MESFINAVRESLRNKNWYAALFTALPLPDICGKLETPNISSSQRYKDWFDEYMLEKYTARVGPDRELKHFLTGNDFYALRCAYLHEGVSDISEQRAQKVLEDYSFIAPQNGGMIHNNWIKNSLQLQIDIFCEDLCIGIENWLEEVKNDEDVQERISQMFKLQSISDGL